MGVLLRVGVWVFSILCATPSFAKGLSELKPADATKIEVKQTTTTTTTVETTSEQEVAPEQEVVPEVKVDKQPQPQEPSAASLFVADRLFLGFSKGWKTGLVPKKQTQLWQASGLADVWISFEVLPREQRGDLLIGLRYAPMVAFIQEGVGETFGIYEAVLSRTLIFATWMQPLPGVQGQSFRVGGRLGLGFSKLDTYAMGSAPVSGKPSGAGVAGELQLLADWEILPKVRLGPTLGYFVGHARFVELLATASFSF